MFLSRPQRWGWAPTACALAPLVGVLPGVLRLQDLLAGAWNGWWHCGHQPEDKAVWITAVVLPSGPEFGTTGATVGRALQWRQPQVLFARAPRPDPRGGRRLYTWRKFLTPLRREETGEPLRRQTRPRRVEQWDDPPPCRFLRPRRRLTLFERTTAAGRDHAVGVDRWGRVWDNDPARQPPPYPGREATWREVAYDVHALLPVVTEVWWAVLPEPGGVHATAMWPDAPSRAGPGPVQDRMYELFPETIRLAGDWERGGPERAPPPAVPRACGGKPLRQAPPPLPPSAPTREWGPGPAA